MNPVIAVLLAAIGAVGGGAGISAWRRVRSQNKLDNATAVNTEADTVARWQNMYDGLQQRVLLMENEMSELRDAARSAESSAAEARLEAQRARTDKARAQTRVAELEAELAKALKTAGDERHALRAEFAEYRLEQEQRELALREELDVRSTGYEATITDLTARVETLSAQLGDNERRRDGDRRGTDQP